MAKLEDVRRVAMSLPGVEEGTSGHQAGATVWRVAGKLFVFERPLRRGDLEALGDAAPSGTVVGARVPDEGVKQAWVAAEPGVFLTTPHFDGYPIVLVALDALPADRVDELVELAWRSVAPARLVRELDRA